METIEITARDDAASCAVKDGPVVIVDDDPYDAIFAEAIFDELQPHHPIQILSSGEDLIAYLQGDGLYSDRAQYPFPSVVVLDLKMPGMDGFGVLRWLKAHPEFSEVPIVVLSGFIDMVEMVTKAYGQGARSFLTKPVQLRDVKSVISYLNVSI